MIVPIKGKVTYPITLDPSVWIFDDRKIEWEHAFTDGSNVLEDDENDLKRASERWEKEVSEQVKPPVNRSIKRYERDKILKSSYVIPLEDFLNHAEINADATEAVLIREIGNVTIPLVELFNSYFLFSKDGKPLRTDGPVHLYYKDGTNKNNPITHITGISIQ
ncbi:hypothetical protein J32TS6_07720 [Virgibacillus pantothenticus]|uniref:hypothetical protein n=1 Tax=Virgibacillus TaxID=84406 RepID=UPI00090BD18B|nr:MULTISPECIES: hypothetical protein [Virgibacillus]API93762.1 hypothetical protein BKP57_19260 [Virgibacillus sp. 6R]MBS7429823.1 hypothetical protein [Virgibacillus sp. 19R1-5]MBU8565083.1 hypothetical protein [Virgibacillus pantothenticus]MBU8601029.1 hypothetical protein [Virgibacillus pantothenticus]MBU8633208.1 hypothetical protein [Virgibacillus pantothenticus]